MTTENKWTIQELVARYELEPELLDVFVEGSFDREVLSQVRSGAPGVRTYYEIEVVDVPAAVLVAHGLTSGNKQRVVALSKELSAVPPDAKVVCLADRDLDHWFGALPDLPRLKWSVFCSLENHFLTAETIVDIAITTGRARITNTSVFVDSLVIALKQLYSLRLADRELGLNLKWVATRKYLARAKDTLSFDITKYVVAVLSSNAQTKRKEEFLAVADRWQQKLTCDARLACRGHDYTELLAWAIAEFGGQKEFASEVAVQRLFILLARLVKTLPTELQ